MFKRPKYFTVRQDQKKEIPEGLWVKCPVCNEILYTKDLERNLKVCHKCAHHFRLTASERIAITVDDQFEEFETTVQSTDVLGFPGYTDKLAVAQEATGLQEAVVTGQGTIGGLPAVIGVMDSGFVMGSMGVVVGEKITHAIETATEHRLPLVIFTASGGARMQEGILSLMQMVRTSAALARLHQARILYVSVLCDPTMGGVSASFGFLGDLMLAEPGSQVGFTGPRVIEQTIRQKLPEGFQTAEFLRDHGFVDKVVHRAMLKQTLAQILSLHRREE